MIAENVSLAWSIFCGVGILGVIAFIYSMCKVAASADAHIDEGLTQVYGKKDEE